MTRVLIQELTSVGCSMCAAAQEFFERDLKKRFPGVETEYIEFLSPRGQELGAKYGIFFLPGVIVNDEFFSFGGVDKNKIIAKIATILGQ